MIDTIGAPELIIILLIVVVLFGAGKVGKLGKELGSSVKEFRRAVHDEDEQPAPTVGLKATLTAPPATPAAASPAPEAGSQPSAPSIF
jgi:sec-independent protein translocase protein TatA